MSTFYLKRGDTLPIFQVVLKNPDNTAHDLTGSTAWKLHVKLAATVFTRDLVKQGADTAGTLRYVWVADDWDPLNLAGYLPTPAGALAEYPMEYEVIGGASGRLTFPNTGHDLLRITLDIAGG